MSQHEAEPLRSCKGLSLLKGPELARFNNRAVGTAALDMDGINHWFALCPVLPPSIPVIFNCTSAWDRAKNADRRAEKIRDTWRAIVEGYRELARVHLSSSK